MELNVVNVSLREGSAVVEITVTDEGGDYAGRYLLEYEKRNAEWLISRAVFGIA